MWVTLCTEFQIFIANFWVTVSTRVRVIICYSGFVILTTAENYSWNGGFQLVLKVVHCSIIIIYYSRLFLVY